MSAEVHGELFNMLDKRLGALEDGQHIIRTDVAVIKNRQADVIADLAQMRVTIYGNGQPGLVTKVALIWQKVALISAIIGGGISVLGTLLIAIFKGK